MPINLMAYSSIGLGKRKRATLTHGSLLSCAVLLCILSCSVCALSVNGANTRQSHRVVVVGKVIIDEYRSPHQDPSSGTISVGGGGPQAAFGAAAALAVLNDSSQPQPVTFFGPIGKDWTDREDKAIQDMLSSAIDTIHLVEGDSSCTPRIQLWHDEEQRVQWMPLNDSFGPAGADNLWRDRPSATNVLEALNGNDEIDCLHVILEAGAESPGRGADASLLADPDLLARTRYLGVEPVTFANDVTGKVSAQDAASCLSRIQSINGLDFVSPDEALHQALDRSSWKRWNVAVRKGPFGSEFFERGSDGGIAIPVASLATHDGKPVNPTGAGNAYAAAMTTCLALGTPTIEAGCIATAIGAVMCEYEHVPPWNKAVLDRIRKAKAEVCRKEAPFI